MSLLPSFCAIVVGAASFAVSYNTLRLEAIRVDAVAPGWPSYLLPLMLDGAVLSGSAVLWKASLEGTKRPVFPFLFVAALVALSVVVNVSHAGPTLLSQLLASLPPLVLLGCLELVQISHRSARRSRAQSTVTGTVEQPADLLAQQVTASVAPTTETTAQTAPTAERGAAALPNRETVAAAPQTTTTERPTAARPATPVPPSAPAGALATAGVVEAPAETTTVTRHPVDAAAREPQRRPAIAPTVAAAASSAAPQPADSSSADSPSAHRGPARRQLRVSAAAPGTDAGTAPGAPAPQPATGGAGEDMPAADRIRLMFEEHVMRGGDPADPQLAASIASTVSVSAQYARKVIKPLRDEKVAALAS